MLLTLDSEKGIIRVLFGFSAALKLSTTTSLCVELVLVDQDCNCSALALRIVVK